MNFVEQAAEHFINRGAAISRIAPHGHGIIHDTYLVQTKRDADSFILQRINQEVFADPAATMHNLRLVSEHALEQQELIGGEIGADWQMLRVRTARDGREVFIDAAGEYWRALDLIREAVPLEEISSAEEAMEVGRALGTFHRLVSNLDPALLHQTLPGFHNITAYLAQYDALPDRGGDIPAPERYCRQIIAARRGWAPVLENARRKNLLRLQVIHGDPKINNIMVNRASGKAVSIIDLDTVMPGPVQYDIGDCLRSCCNTRGEDADYLSGVRFDIQRCNAMLAGYTAVARSFLTDADFDFFYDGVRLIPFELGLRFYMDFLAGNVYFKVCSREQNLNRAMVQFKLLESIEEQEYRIRAIIAANRAALRHTNNR